MNRSKKQKKFMDGTSLKLFAAAQLKAATDNANKGYLLLTLERIKSPEKAKPTLHQAAPPGAPIGCAMDE